MSDPDWWYCDPDDNYEGPGKIYPISHGTDCPGHRDWVNEFSDRVNNYKTDPDSRPLPRPDKWWGYTDEVVEVDPRYL